MGAKEMMDLFSKIHDEGTTIILVTHDMDILLSYCNKVVVMEEGKIIRQCSPNSLFDFDCEAYFKGDGMKLDLNSVKDVSSLSKEIIKARRKK